MNLITKLKKQEIAWKAFNLFLEGYDFSPNTVFEEIRYEYQLGVFLKFFEHYNMDTDTCPGLFEIQNSVEEYKEGIELGFKQLNSDIKNGIK